MTASIPNKATGHGRLILILGLALLLGASLLISSRRPERHPDNLRILCSFLPVFVFTQNVVGHTPGVQVEMLLSPDLGCPHDYALGPNDIVRLNQANLVIVNGLGAEPFMDELLANKSPDKILTIADDTDALPIDPAGEHEHDEADEHHAETGHGHHHTGRYNPHVWASPIQAAREVRTLARKLSAADPAHADDYKHNAEYYASTLEQLAAQMRQAATGFKGRNIVTFHDAFAYLARDLDLNVVATLTIDPQAGVSANRMGELDRTIRENHVAAIFCEPAYSDGIARTLSGQTGVPVYPLNPFNYFKGPPTVDAYERVMRDNLHNLEMALGAKP